MYTNTENWCFSLRQVCRHWQHRGYHNDSLWCRQWQDNWHHVFRHHTQIIQLLAAPTGNEMRISRLSIWSPSEVPYLWQPAPDLYSWELIGSRPRLPVALPGLATELTYRWLSARLQYLHGVSNGVTAVLHCVWKCRLRNGVHFVSASMC